MVVYFFFNLLDSIKHWHMTELHDQNSHATSSWSRVLPFILLTAVDNVLVNVILEFNTGFLPVRHQREISFFTVYPFIFLIHRVWGTQIQDMLSDDCSLKHTYAHTLRNQHHQPYIMKCISICECWCVFPLWLFPFSCILRDSVCLWGQRSPRTTELQLIAASALRLRERERMKKKCFQWEISMEQVNRARVRGREVRRKEADCFCKKILMKSGNRKAEWVEHDQYSVMTPVWRKESVTLTLRGRKWVLGSAERKITNAPMLCVLKYPRSSLNEVCFILIFKQSYGRAK